MDPLTWIALVLAAAGAVTSLWLLRGRDRLRLDAERARAERDLAMARLADAEAVRQNFQAVAGEVLRSSNEEFLRLAKETLAARDTKALSELDKRTRSIDELVKPIEETLRKTREEIMKVERGHLGLREQVTSMGEANKLLREETGKLSQALRKPNVRGRYGELQLERVVELAGMRPYCDFTRQENLRDEQGALQKPDLIVRLPNGRAVAIDAKTSIDSYLDAIDTDSPEEIAAHLDRYADNVVLQAQRLSRKEYWSSFDSTLELVVMFIPGDQLVDAALERRPKLIELAAELNVIIASPSTLIGLLRAIHIGWREQSLSDSAQELFGLGRELHDRAAVAFRHAGLVGDALDRARESYNRFVRSVDSRLYPTLRKFEERGARSAKELVELSQIEGQTQELRGMGNEIITPAPPPALFESTPAESTPAEPRPAEPRPAKKPAPDAEPEPQTKGADADATPSESAATGAD